MDAFNTSGHKHPADTLSLWGSHCDSPTPKFDDLRWASRHGGTTPSTILTTPPALAAVQKSDVWFLLTDGEIWDGDVHRLADLALETGILNIPLVFLITGGRGKGPSSTNISVGISFFASAQDTLILFQETSTGKIFVIAGKGCFTTLGGSAAAQDLENWEDLQCFNTYAALFEHLSKMEIQVQVAETRAGAAKGVSLGAEWEEQQDGPIRVDLDLLPQAGFLSDADIGGLLGEQAFDTLAVAYKTRSRTSELRGLLQRQKVEQVAPKLKDVAGAAGIIARLADKSISAASRKVLQDQLRAAHMQNREHYRESITDLETSEEAQQIKKRNLLVDAALRSLASIEAAGFNAEILSRRSNRARRADVVTSVPALEITNLDLDAPGYKGFCLVCCGEDEVMSICFKEPQPDHADDNTSDFALNFPLAAGASVNNVNLISSQNVCFQCAIAMGNRSVYQEELTAVVPALQYEGSNKKYINDQLYLALTARLATGAAGISQLFMSTLHRVLKTKSWAGAEVDQTQVTGEARQRRETFQWMTDQLATKTYTREDFKETGEWVPFPQAIGWAARDFEENGLASFAVTYPAVGFVTLLDLGVRHDGFSNETVNKLRAAKALHSIASKYLAELQGALQNRVDDKWRQKYLEIIYQNFNGPLTPVDQGAASLVVDNDVFITRLGACIDTKTVTQGLEGDDLIAVIRKTQIILFWLLFYQKGHCTAQTFFTRMRSSEALATVVLDINPTKVPQAEHENLLLSFFVQQEGELIDPSAAKLHTAIIPFANPFGASVLHCGAPGCNAQFCTAEVRNEVTPRLANSTRDARTKHLIQVFGIKSRFEKSMTGLPDRPDTGSAPSSIHTNLHISIAREWARHTTEQRRDILTNTAAQEDFILSVRTHLCKEGRGNIFQNDIDGDTRALLPSFFAVLKKAVMLQGKNGDEDEVAGYEHDFDTRGSLEEKMKWELEARKTATGERGGDEWEMI